MLLLRFACGITLAMEEGQDRKVGIGRGREVKIVSNREMELGVADPAQVFSKVVDQSRFDGSHGPLLCFNHSVNLLIYVFNQMARWKYYYVYSNDSKSITVVARNNLFKVPLQPVSELIIVHASATFVCQRF